MKSYLLVCIVAAAILVTQGYRHSYMHETRTFQDESLSALDNMEDPASGAPPPLPPQPPKLPQPPPNPHNCSCKKVCRELHDDRLPMEVQDEHRYLSYENFPVLCRDGASIYLPPKDQNKPQKKYICKQTFDCCRYCNAMFYKCVDNIANTYGFCMRGAYKCMCQCIDNKSFKELPFPSPPVKTPAPPPALPGQ